MRICNFWEWSKFYFIKTPLLPVVWKTWSLCVQTSKREDTIISEQSLHEKWWVGTESLRFRSLYCLRCTPDLAIFDCYGCTLQYVSQTKTNDDLKWRMRQIETTQILRVKALIQKAWPACARDQDDERTRISPHSNKSQVEKPKWIRHAVDRENMDLEIISMYLRLVVIEYDPPPDGHKFELITISKVHQIVKGWGRDRRFHMV